MFRPEHTSDELKRIIKGLTQKRDRSKKDLQLVGEDVDELTKELKTEIERAQFTADEFANLLKLQRNPGLAKQEASKSSFEFSDEPDGVAEADEVKSKDIHKAKDTLNLDNEASFEDQQAENKLNAKISQIQTTLHGQKNRIEDLKSKLKELKLLFKRRDIDYQKDARLLADTETDLKLTLDYERKEDMMKHCNPNEDDDPKLKTSSRLF